MSVRQVRYRQNGVRTGRNLYMLNRGVSSSMCLELGREYGATSTVSGGPVR